MEEGHCGGKCGAFAAGELVGTNSSSKPLKSYDRKSIFLEETSALKSPFYVCMPKITKVRFRGLVLGLSFENLAEDFFHLEGGVHMWNVRDVFGLL